MSCTGEKKSQAGSLEEASRIASAQVNAAPVCQHSGCGQPLDAQQQCPRGHGHEDGAAEEHPEREPRGQSREAELSTLRAALLRRHAGIELWINLSASGHLVVGKIVVPREQRGRGIGSAIMQELVAVADRWGVPMALTPDRTFGGSVSRLREFYRGFGFVPNKGRAMDYTTLETMVRPVPPGRKAAESVAPGEQR